MANPSGAVQILLELANAALLPGTNAEEQLVAIETYCEQFKQLENQLDADSPELSELAEKHHRVLETARELLGGAAKDIQLFKRKARGIMAYVDILPQKINVTGTKKG